MRKRNVTIRTAAETAFAEGLPKSDEFLREWERTAERRQLGRMLEQMRRDKGYTQKELAGLMGKDQAFVARMESGQGDMPKAENIALYAEHCGFATAYAFVEQSDRGLTLHEMQPIGRSRIAGNLEQVHDIELSIRDDNVLEDQY
jgi:transcriptional regulator with XRE-family HTH domain